MPLTYTVSIPGQFPPKNDRGQSPDSQNTPSGDGRVGIIRPSQKETGSTGSCVKSRRKTYASAESCSYIRPLLVGVSSDFHGCRYHFGTRGLVVPGTR